jgi:hypothetical protein
MALVMSEMHTAEPVVTIEKTKRYTSPGKYQIPRELIHK